MTRAWHRRLAESNAHGGGSNDLLRPPASHLTPKARVTGPLRAHHEYGWIDLRVLSGLLVWCGEGGTDASGMSWTPALVDVHPKLCLVIVVEDIDDTLGLCHERHERIPPKGHARNIGIIVLRLF